MPKPSLRHGTGKWIETSLCDVCQEAELTGDEDRRRRRAIAEHLGRAGIPALFASAELEGLRGDLQPALTEAMHDAKYNGKNLYLYGDTGRGKTHVAAALLKHGIRETARPGYFWSVPKLMDALRDGARGGRAAALTDELSRASALVLDDLGAEKVTEYALERLYMLLDHWCGEKRKRLVVTSNLSTGQIHDKLDPRIASRIVGMCRIVEVKGDDWRLKKAQGGA